MRLHVLQHVPFEGPARIARWADERGHDLTVSHLYAGDAPPEVESFDRLIVMGGPMGVKDQQAHPWLGPEKRCIAAAIDAGRSVVGICLGAQLIADVLGARVYRAAQKEIGWFPVALTDRGCTHPLCDGLPVEQTVFQWHGDTFDLPPGAVHLYQSDVCAQQAFLAEGRILGLQFHLESTPESVAALCTHCADEVEPGPNVQTLEAMQANATHELEAMHRSLATLLDRLPC